MIDSVSIQERIKVLPPLSHSASRLLSVMGRRYHQVTDIVNVVEHDSALTAAVLRMVNSAAFSLSREVLTVKDAVAYLGDTKIVSIAMAATGGDIFNAELKGYRGSRGDLGRHCLYTALVSRELARHSRGGVDPGVAFTSGLLHDIGKAMISDFLGDSTDDILASLENKELPDYRAAEQKHLGTDHCEAGYEMANHWGLPFALRVGIKYHHTPFDAIGEEKPMAHVIHLADMLVMMQGHGTGADTLYYSLDSGYLEFVKIPTGELEQVVLNLQDEFQRTAELLFGEAPEPD